MNSTGQIPGKSISYSWFKICEDQNYWFFVWVSGGCSGKGNKADGKEKTFIFGSNSLNVCSAWHSLSYVEPEFHTSLAVVKRGDGVPPSAS